MDYLKQLAAEYEGIISVFGVVVGVLGFLFGVWRYFREHVTQENLNQKQTELNDALSRLERLDNFASGLKKCTAEDDISIWTTIPAQVLSQPRVPVLSVGNLKGGVGKTTVVANLASALAKRGLRVLAIDMDFQASLSVALPPNIMPRREDSDGAVSALLGESYDMFHDGRVTGRGVKPFADLSLVRTSFRLADVEDQLFAAFILGRYKLDPRFALAKKLSDQRLKNDFDLVLIDTPPRLTMASINALCASTHVLIPTALTPMSQSGAITFVEYLKKFRDTLCPKLQVLGILPTLTRGTLNGAEDKSLDHLMRMLPGVNVWRDNHIPYRQAIADNLAHNNAEAREKFEKLAEKLVGELGLRTDGKHEGSRVDRSPQFGRAHSS